MKTFTKYFFAVLLVGAFASDAFAFGRRGQCQSCQTCQPAQSTQPAQNVQYYQQVVTQSGVVYLIPIANYNSLQPQTQQGIYQSPAVIYGGCPNGRCNIR